MRLEGVQVEANMVTGFFLLSNKNQVEVAGAWLQLTTMAMFLVVVAAVIIAVLG